MDNKPPIKQLCLIQIVFPANDDTAIDVKKKIEITLTEIEDKRVELHLTPLPSTRTPIA